MLIAHFFASHCLSTPLISPKQGKTKTDGLIDSIEQAIHFLQPKANARDTAHNTSTQQRWPKTDVPNKENEKSKKVTDVQPDVVSKA